MKNFNENKYASLYRKDMQNKIIGYDLMSELIFHGVLPVEAQNKTIQNILFIGGGGGNEAIQAQTLFPNASLDIVDPSEEMLAIGRDDRKLKICGKKNITFIPKKFEDYSINKTYDIIFCLLVIHFIPDKKLFIDKIKSAISHSGILLLSSFHTYRIK